MLFFISWSFCFVLSLGTSSPLLRLHSSLSVILTLPLPSPVVTDVCRPRRFPSLCGRAALWGSWTGIALASGVSMWAGHGFSQNVAMMWLISCFVSFLCSCLLLEPIKVLLHLFSEVLVYAHLFFYSLQLQCFGPLSPLFSAAEGSNKALSSKKKPVVLQLAPRQSWWLTCWWT